MSEDCCHWRGLLLFGCKDLALSKFVPLGDKYYILVLTLYHLLCNSRKKTMKGKSRLTRWEASMEAGNASENGQGYSKAKTVGWPRNRYRLGHLWVSEMMLNVQSGSLLLPFYMPNKGLFPFIFFLFYHYRIKRIRRSTKDTLFFHLWLSYSKFNNRVLLGLSNELLMISVGVWILLSMMALSRSKGSRYELRYMLEPWNYRVHYSDHKWLNSMKTTTMEVPI